MPQDLRAYVEENREALDLFEENRRQIREQQLYSAPEPVITTEQVIALIILLCIFIPFAWHLSEQYRANFSLPNL